MFDTPAGGDRDVLAGRNVLARIGYGHHGGRPTLYRGSPRIDVHMMTAADVPFTEVWVTDRPVRCGLQDNLVYAEDGEHFFCAVRVEESGVYRDAVRTAYGAAFRLARQQGYTDLFRMWNLVGDITGANAEGTEIYQDFCAGRALAFEEWSEHFEGMPAATGIGSLGTGIDLYFLACRPGRTTHLENPRQTPAHRYPDRYGPLPPSFARGTHLASDGYGPGAVYVSGTASILGDDTVHPDDIERQLDVTLANIETLVSEQNLRRHAVDAGYGLAELDRVKVYVRDAEHLPAVRARCAEVFPGGADVVFLNVGICRPDLLVEMEGICR
ncbi:FkbO/Hyg5 family chorismatase [Streptomyces viridosporus]|uniref:FkbO/Hyg5 family chorismatase n=1 Tax=Streptomyces viridosporus TaxID=67581 RepID=UPI0021005880|nr:FkbO/Hyg5 family chorismatase [Streptomyces viridosporus]